MPKKPLRARLVAGLLFVSTCLAQATTLTLDVPSSRSPIDVEAIADQAVRRFGKNLAVLTARQREFAARAGRGLPVLTQPVSVIVLRDGRAAPPSEGRGRGAGITLTFSSNPARQFPADYRALLEAVFAKAEARMTSVFGDPSVGGEVLVSNYDADIGERDAVAGGYYLYDAGSGLQEIRFPVYSDAVGIKPEVAAVNFVHTLLLAYLGPKKLPYDAWQEGLARAATMVVCRTPGALPAALDADSVEQVLESTYEVGATYDWCNQSALGGPVFIAPNLRSADLPIGGSVGGLYLLRYQMAGSAWQKVLAEYPTFAATFLPRYYVNPGAYTTKAQLAALAQQSLDAIAGANATIEGRGFAAWAKRQWILDTSLVAGPKLLVQPFAIADGLSGSDFGVFGIQAHWFESKANGDESLLKDVSYPIYFSPDYTRIFASAQDDRMDLFGGYGSVAPNFPGSAFNNEPYRVVVDVPVQDRVARCTLPAGAVATAARPTPNNFYGCLTGFPESPDVAYSVRVSWGVGGTSTLPVTHMAFGGLLDPNTFEKTLAGVTIEVLRTSQGATATVLTRKANKGPGPLAVDLVLDGDQSLTLPIAKGINFLSLSGTPIVALLPELLGLDPGATLAARWNPTLSRYTLFPDFGSAPTGGGFYLRSEDSRDVAYESLCPPNTPLSVSLKPGWNMVANPLLEAVDAKDVMVFVTNGFARTWDDAVSAGLIGPAMFSFFPGSPDPVSGAPETGTLLPASSFLVGQPLFVKVLSPDGVTLLFPTSAFRGRAKDPGPSPITWEMSVEVSGAGSTAAARIGRSPQGSVDVRSKLNAELPPGLGGLQVSLRGGARLYQDVRPERKAGTYTIRLEGLRRGERYTVDLSTVRGKPNRYVLWDPRSQARRTCTGDERYEFVARETARTIYITVAQS